MKKKTKSNPIDVRIGQNLRHKREVGGWTRAELGEQIGISGQAIEKYENGENRISGSVMAECALALRFPVADLFKGIHKDEDEQVFDQSETELMRIWKDIPDANVRSAVKRCMKALAIELAHIYTGKKSRA